MREIKFRAWNSRERKMTTPALWVNELNLPCNQLGSAPDTPLMQFTGLLDKNGVDIYEGDILLCKDDSFPVEVKFHSDGCFRPFLYGLAKDLTVSQWMTARKRAMLGSPCLVIGNIYENPELLENNNV